VLNFDFELEKTQKLQNVIDKYLEVMKCTKNFWVDMFRTV
jgi:hypothetical protein